MHNHVLSVGNPVDANVVQDTCGDHVVSVCVGATIVPDFVRAFTIYDSVGACVMGDSVGDGAGDGVGNGDKPASE